MKEQNEASTQNEILSVLKQIRGRMNINFIFFLFSVGYLNDEIIAIYNSLTGFWSKALSFLLFWILHPFLVGLKMAGIEILNYLKIQ